MPSLNTSTSTSAILHLHHQTQITFQIPIECYNQWSQSLQARRLHQEVKSENCQSSEKCFLRTRGNRLGRGNNKKYNCVAMLYIFSSSSVLITKIFYQFYFIITSSVISRFYILLSSQNPIYFFLSHFVALLGDANLKLNFNFILYFIIDSTAR